MYQPVEAANIDPIHVLLGDVYIFKTSSGIMIYARVLFFLHSPLMFMYYTDWYKSGASACIHNILRAPRARVCVIDAFCTADVYTYIWRHWLHYRRLCYTGNFYIQHNILYIYVYIYIIRYQRRAHKNNNTARGVDRTGNVMFVHHAIRRRCRRTSRHWPHVVFAYKHT